MQQRRFWRHLVQVVLVLAALGLSIWVLSLVILPTARNAAAAPQRPQSKTTQPFTLTSPDFTEDGPLPQSSAFNRYGCQGKNIAPTLNWQGAPAGTASFALEVTD